MSRVPSLQLQLAPVAIMCLVACGQFWLASTRHLSPWKGGGFGMFASTDDPGARLFQVVGETTDGTPVIIRSAFSGAAQSAVLKSAAARRLQTFPEEALLRRVGEALVQLEFVEIDEPDLWRRDRFVAQNPDVKALLPSPRQRPQLELRPLNPLASGHAESRRYRLRAVTLRIWRSEFDAQTKTLTLRPLMGPVEVTEGI